MNSRKNYYNNTMISTENKKQQKKLKLLSVGLIFNSVYFLAMNCTKNMKKWREVEKKSVILIIYYQ